MNTPAPGYYPDPRRNHMGLHAYWDGERWHLDATTPTEAAEWVSIGLGLVLSVVLCAIFPPAVVVVGIGAWFYFYYSNKKKKRLQAQLEWDQQHSLPPRINASTETEASWP